MSLAEHGAWKLGCNPARLSSANSGVEVGCLHFQGCFVQWSREHGLFWGICWVILYIGIMENNMETTIAGNAEQPNITPIYYSTEILNPKPQIQKKT